MKLTVIYLACHWFLTGCANQKVMSQTTETQVTTSQATVEVVSVPEDFQNFIVKGDRICGMPSPSGSVADTGPSFSIATPATGQDSFNDGSITTSSQNHGDSAYVADEVLYRLCEIGISYQLSKEEMLDYYIKTLRLLVDVATSKDVLPPEISSSAETTEEDGATGTAKAKTD